MSTSSRKKPRHDDDDDDGGGGGESSSSNSRLAALSIALSSLLLSSGLATVLYVYTESLRDQFDDGDVDEPAQVVAWWTAEAAFKWALISAGGSLSGIVGILVRNASIHRIFAVSTFADLLLTLLLTFTLSLLTLTPSLAPTFGSFLCSSVLASWYDSPSPLDHRPHVERDDTSRSRSDTSLLLGGAGGAGETRGGGERSWGVEACDDEWKLAMVQVLAGCVVAVALRIYGVYVSWEHNVELRRRHAVQQQQQRRRRRRHDGSLVLSDSPDPWSDVDCADSPSPQRKRGGGGGEKPQKKERRRSSPSCFLLGSFEPRGRGGSVTAGPSPRRMSSGSSSGSIRRSNTLPTTRSPPPPYPRDDDDDADERENDRRRRSGSSASLLSSSSRPRSSHPRPRLVLLPVYVDRDGNPVGGAISSSPTSYTSSTSSSSQRARSMTSPASSSSSSGSSVSATTTNNKGYDSKTTTGSVSRSRPQPVGFGGAALKRDRSQSSPHHHMNEPRSSRRSTLPSPASPSPSSSSSTSCLSSSSATTAISPRLIDRTSLPCSIMV
ncbi:hypothetical protein JCM3766R1_000821 [Sporobolomyces carnicolor]